MRPAVARTFAAGAALLLGAALVLVSASVPVAVGAAPGSVLNTGPDGLSSFGMMLRDGGLLAQSVRIDAGADGIGISPLPWTAWDLGPGDTILSVRSDVALSDAEVGAALAWLEGGGRLVVVGDDGTHLEIAQQLLGRRIAFVPVRDGAFDQHPRRPIVPDGSRLYQLDDAMAVSGGEALLASPGLAWSDVERPDDTGDLQPFAFAARFPIGQGEVLVYGDSHPLSNGGLGERDNGELAQDLLGRMAGGQVFVDEGHRSGTGTLRLDLAMRAIGEAGRTVLALLAIAALAAVVAPRPRRLLARLQRLAATPPPEVRKDAVADVLAKHPEWDPRLLTRIWGGDGRGADDGP